MSILTGYWHVVSRLPPWACVRALADLADKGRRAAFARVEPLLFPPGSELPLTGVLPDEGRDAAILLALAGDVDGAAALFGVWSGPPVPPVDVPPAAPRVQPIGPRRDSLIARFLAACLPGWVGRALGVEPHGKAEAAF